MILEERKLLEIIKRLIISLKKCLKNNCQNHKALVVKTLCEEQYKLLDNVYKMSFDRVLEIVLQSKKKKKIHN